MTPEDMSFYVKGSRSSLLGAGKTLPERVSERSALICMHAYTQWPSAVQKSIAQFRTFPSELVVDFCRPGTNLDFLRPSRTFEDA